VSEIIKEIDNIKKNGDKKMEEIIESITNGQRKQALEQIKESQYKLDDLFEELLENGMGEEIIKMYRIAVSTGYIRF